LVWERDDGDVPTATRASSAEVAPVAPSRLGQRHVPEHGPFIEHVAEEDAPPEIHPADGGGSERDGLGASVEAELGGRVRDGEHPVPLRLLNPQQPGSPALCVGVVELEPELEGGEGVPEDGDDVAGVGAAHDGGILVPEAFGGLREPVEVGGARARTGRVDEVVEGGGVVDDAEPGMVTQRRARSACVLTTSGQYLTQRTAGVPAAGPKTVPTWGPRTGPGKWTQR
jgi:hypothetical protein